jgi:hypothetical protein
MLDVWLAISATTLAGIAVAAGLVAWVRRIPASRSTRTGRAGGHPAAGPETTGTARRAHCPG